MAIRYEVNGILFDTIEQAKHYERENNSHKYVLFNGINCVDAIDESICIYLSDEEATEELLKQAENENLDISEIKKGESGLFYWDRYDCDYKYIDIEIAQALAKFLKIIKK